MAMIPPYGDNGGILMILICLRRGAALRAVPLCHFSCCPGLEPLGLFSTQGALPGGKVAFRVDVNTRLAAANSHDTYGLTLSLWRDCFFRPRRAWRARSLHGAGPGPIDEILDRGQRQCPAAAVQPNIIVAQSESFLRSDPAAGPSV